MKTIERKGKSEFAVVTDFAKEFNIPRTKLKYEVIDQGSKGFFSLFGAKPVKIRFFIEDDFQALKSFTRELLEKMNIEVESIQMQKENDSINVTIAAPEVKGFLIGKDGKMLDSIQHLLNRYMKKTDEQALNIVLDVDNYRQKKVEKLLFKVKNISEKVRNSGKSFTMDPLIAPDRKLIHQFIENEKDLRTLTVGKGAKKRIVIMKDQPNNMSGGKPNRNNNNRPYYRKKNNSNKGGRRPQRTENE
jgi:spoIIIJ-associated protein